MHLTRKTGLLDLKIGETAVRKSLYILPIPQFDAIVGMPFFKENEIDLTELDWGIVKANGSKVSVGRDSDQKDPEAENPTIAMISRKALKKEHRRDNVDELDLVIIWETADKEDVQASIITDLKGLRNNISRRIATRKCRLSE